MYFEKKKNKQTKIELLSQRKIKQTFPSTRIAGTTKRERHRAIRDRITNSRISTFG